MTEIKEKRVCVIAVDGSKHSDYAVQWYKDNICKPGDYVILVHAVDHRKMYHYGTVAMVPGNPDTLTHAYAKEEEKANTIVTRAMKKIKELGIEGEAVKMTGEPGPAVVKKAHDSNSDFIVCGCRGEGVLRRTFLGSVSDFIMHHSEVPVFVCRQ